MAAPRKYPDELRERVVRLAVDARKDARTGYRAAPLLLDAGPHHCWWERGPSRPEVSSA